MATKVIFLKTTGSGTFTLPSDFVSFISVEALGGGSGGGVSGKFGGGGAGAYAKSTTFTTTGWTAGSTILYYNVGTGGASGASPTAGGTTWMAATNAIPASATSGALGVKSAGGAAPSGYLRGLGGIIANCTGDIRYAGARGGSANSNGAILVGLAGGGGAAGPNGGGGFGGSSDGTTNTLATVGNGGGGGAAATSSGGNAGGGSDGFTGGYGGSSGFNTGGTGGNQYSPGYSGGLGSGGGGGFGDNSVYVGSGNGGDGSADAVWTQTSNGEVAGPGGAPGAGYPAGGLGTNAYGAAMSPSSTFVSNGGPGIIIFTYVASDIVVTPYTVGKSGVANYVNTKSSLMINGAGVAAAGGLGGSGETVVGS
jgi:hypothetical protein